VVPLGTTSRSGLKSPNYFYRPFILNVFTTIKKNSSCLSIACINIWLEVYFGISKMEIVIIFYFYFKWPLHKLIALTMEIHN
jgi:hypothetical protein